MKTEYPRLHEPFALDIETYDPNLKTLGPGPRRGDGRILGVSIATENREWWLPMNDHIREWLRTHDHLDIIGANISYDLDWLQYETYIPSGRAWDIQVAEALLDEYKPTYSLDSLAKEYLGIGKETTEIDAWCAERGLKGDSRKHLYLMPEELVAKYAKIDVRRTYDVFQIQKKRIAEQGLEGIFELETDLLPMLMQMRRRGVRIDEEQLERNIITAQDLLKTEQLSLNREAGFEVNVNVNAARQLVRLFDKLHLDYPRTDKGNPSFTAAFLESMEHPIAEKILRIRHLFKLDSTFLTGYKRFIVNGRIHPLFHPTRNGFGGTVSGRFSSSAPNMQQLPSRDPVIKNLTRGLFIPEEGMQFFKMDYSSVEYRAFAHYAQGPGAERIRQEYADNPKLDYHQITADIAGITRPTSKVLNFMILFGGGVDKTALMLNLPREKASQFLSQYHSRLPFIKTTTKTVQQVWQQRGYIRSILGRQFRYDGKGYTGANRLTQSFGADLIKRAMVRAYQEGLTESLFISLQVHDELSGSFGDLDDLRKLKEIMEYSPESKVPILADAETGPNWAEVKEVEL